MKEGQNISRPPLLEEPNYGYLKSKMKAFLKSLNEKAWKAVLIGRTPSTMKDPEGKDVPTLEELWTEANEKDDFGNAKAMNAIFSAVDDNIFKLISKCEIAKNAWEILKTAHEAIEKVRNSCLQMITSKFEDLKMKEEETITVFNARVLDLSNESAALGVSMKEEKLVGKVLRSLPQRFAMKVTAIEEAQDITKMRLDKLMGSLRTYEMNFPEDMQAKRAKGVALKAVVTKDQTEVDDVSEQLAMMAKNFERIIKKLNRSGSDQGHQSTSNFHNRKGGNFQWRNMHGENNQEFKGDKGKGIQCRDCEGFGHIQVECANRLKKNKKVYAANWSDSESEASQQEDESNKFVAFTSRNEEGSKKSNSLFSSAKSEHSVEESYSSDDEELTDESITESYKFLYENWLMVIDMNKKLSATVAELKVEKENLWEEAAVLVAQKVEQQEEISSLKL
ncbi:unnamed protein product [Rhodiola kirilowii]